MKSKFFLLCAAVIISLPLASCTKNSDEEIAESIFYVSGAKSSIFAALIIGGKQSDLPVRPGSPLGMYVSMYLGQRNSMGVASALEGIDSQVKLLRADSVIEDETFALLQEYGTVLQVDITDTLNRSVNREETLDKYSQSLSRMNTRMAQKQTELDQKLDDIGTQRKEERKEVREMERQIKSDLRDKNYTAAGPKQKELSLLEAKLAETESNEKQTKKVLSIVEDLLEVGEERLEAIINNLEILIAGLQVIDVPGIEELGIVIGK
ncbi:MAG: hypothetical protein K9M03_03390 [Kiritimatiellales bacterium]|nr:hypothetical protein [Kiritimatiellales bacterium]